MGEHSFGRFTDFYPFYLSQHSDRSWRRLHFVGNFWWLVAGLAAGIRP